MKGLYARQQIDSDSGLKRTILREKVIFIMALLLPLEHDSIMSFFFVSHKIAGYEF